MTSPGIPSIDALRSGAARVGAETGCRLVVLFGSAARAGRRDAAREGREPEDVDLAVRADRPVDAVAVTNRFIRALGYQEVDVVDLSRADPLVMMLVARDGIPLYERTAGEFARFSSLAARRYADTRKFREAEREALRERIACAPDGRGVDDGAPAADPGATDRL